MKIAQGMMARLLVCATLSGLFYGSARAATPLDQNCVVSVLNRTVQVDSDGRWAMPNVPSSMGRIKAGATCIQGGQAISGESAYFNNVALWITGDAGTHNLKKWLVKRR
ncbi:MAG: hypothetical protein NTX45_29245 [Proteobacteria bacterium]|nr:hypothetical protein [Pseudomonadota bacterium]